MKKFRSLSIKIKIYVGFFIVGSFIVVIDFFSYQLTKNFSTAFDEYQIIDKKASIIDDIRHRIDSIQTSIQVYISSGYESFALEIGDDITSLIKVIDTARPLFEGDLLSLRDLNHMRILMDTDYKRTLIHASEELMQRNKYVDELNNAHDSLLTNDQFDMNAYLQISLTQSALHQYLTEPDITKVDATIAGLEELGKKYSGLDLLRLDEYKKLFINSVQSNRGFLFLISVVMAGASSEFQYHVEKLEERTKAKMLPLRNKVSRDVKLAVTYLIFIFIILIFTVILIGYFTATSITVPLDKIKNTFDLLSKDKEVMEIPGIFRKDEIGSMARAADVFRQKNESTKLLLNEIQKKNLELESRDKEVVRLETKTKIDGLTSLYNHETFYEILGFELERTLRYERQLSLLMIDIDNFKQINDTHGHQSGDIVLHEIGTLLKGIVRASDSVFRYGGEEITVIQPETNIEYAVNLAERIRKSIEEIEFSSVVGTKFSVTVSIGAANCPSNAKDINDLVNQADLCLYQAKNNGKNRVFFKQKN